MTGYRTPGRRVSLSGEEYVYPEIIKQGNGKPPFTSVELHRLSSCPFSSFYVGEPTTKSPNSPTEALVAGALWHRLRRCVVGLVLFDSEGAHNGDCT